MLIARTLKTRTTGQKALLAAMLAVVALHAILLLVLPHVASVSRICTAAVPLLAAACAIWRSSALSPRERASWGWVSSALALWAAGQVVEAFIARSTSASNLAVDPSDFLYLVAAFPLLMAISNTSETEPIRGIFSLNVTQALLACGLVYVRLFRMTMSPASTSSAMLYIYVGECALLAFAAALRLVTWASAEERRRMRMLCGTLWIYLPIELSLDFATRRWNVQIGTLLDLLWSLPFLYAGWQALHLPMDERPLRRQRRLRVRGVASRLLQSLCPMLITTGVFALAASILSQHLVIALSAMCFLLFLQGLHSGLVQINYLAGQDRLLAQEEALKQANMSLERLSLLDPLTGVPNRRQFTATLEAEWLRAARRHESIALLMVDVDFFKAVNDLHGHVYGDDCLVRIAHILRDGLRQGSDMLARYGGEEFVLVLPATDLEAGIVVAERLQADVSRARLTNGGSPFEQRLTVSIGVSASEPWMGGTASAALDAADQALYEAKRRGRNRLFARAADPVLA